MTTPTQAEIDAIEKRLLGMQSLGWQAAGDAYDAIKSLRTQLADEKRTSESWKLRYDRKCEELAAARALALIKESTKENSNG